MPREILVFGDKAFKITIPDDAKLTYAPWSPPKRDGGHWDEGSKRGTLRVYQGTEKNILACFSGVTGFRDSTLGYMEEVVREGSETIWRSDEHGYVRESKQHGTTAWVVPETAPALQPTETDISDDDKPTGPQF